MIQKKKKLLIFGHYGLPNWGDEAILDGMLKLINEDKWDVTAVSPFPENIMRDHGIPSVPPPPCGIRSYLKGFLAPGKWLSTRSAIRDADYVIFGGGGLFQEQPKRALAIWCSYLQRCRSFGKRILIIGNSIGPFLSQASAEKTARLFRSIPFFSVRDHRSQEALIKMGVPELRISLSTDPAMALPQKRREWKKRKGILISLRREDLSEDETKHVQSFVKYCKGKKIPVEFLSMQTRGSRDDLLGRILAIPVTIPGSLDELREKIVSSKLLLGNRLHAIILSLLSETPFLAISSRPKMMDFLKSCGLSEFSLSKIPSRVLLSNKADSLLKKRAVLQSRLRSVARKEKKKLGSLFPDFF